MSKSIRHILFALCVAALGCDDGTSVQDYEGFGVGHPGSDLPGGGEVLFEKIWWSPLAGSLGTDPEFPALQVNQFHAFHYTNFASAAINAPTGTCVKQTPDSFSLYDIDGDQAVYTDFGANLTLTGAGIGTEGLTIPKIVAGAEGLGDNSYSPYRLHDEGNFIYGGPSWEFDPEDADATAFQGLDIVPGGEYSVNIQNDEGEDIYFNMAREYDFPVINGAEVGLEDFTIPATAAEGFEITWEELLNPDTPHSRTHDFAYIFFFGAEGSYYFCSTLDTEDGSVTVPQAVLDDLDEYGFLQAGRLTHWMEEVSDQRLDVLSIYCGLSFYHKTDDV